MRANTAVRRSGHDGQVVLTHIIDLFGSVEERRIGGDSDDEATFRPVRLRPCKSSMDAGGGAASGQRGCPARSASPNCPKVCCIFIGVEHNLCHLGAQARDEGGGANRTPAKRSNALSPLPMRLDLPPASTMPITPPDARTAVIVPRRGLHRLRRARQLGAAGPGWRISGDLTSTSRCGARPISHPSRAHDLLPAPGGEDQFGRSLDHRFG